jgi:hypothetical protein
MAYTTQTFDHRGGFNVLRLIAGVFVATLVAAVAVGAVMLSPLSNNARALAFHSSVVDRGSLVTLAPGTATSITLRFRNSGLTSWERGVAGSQVDLGVKKDSTEFGRAGLAIGWLSDSRIATTIEPVVPPGAVGTFTFSVRAPAVGVYRVPVQLVVDDVTWLDDQEVFVVIASDYGFHGELVDQSRHPTLRLGETSAPITVQLRNTGKRAWVRGVTGEQVNLGLSGGDPSLTALRVGWPSADRVAIQSEERVGAGDVATFTFRVRAPTTPGTYPLRLRPVVDGVTWLEDVGVMSLITVTSASGQPASPAARTAATTFASSASVAPANVPAGSAASITAALTSTISTTALVGLEVYTPDGASLAYQKWFEAQSFTAGGARSYPATWQVPTSAALGTYTVALRAFAPGWTTQVSSQDVATFAVSAPAVAAPSATTSPATVTTGGDLGTSNANPNANPNSNRKTPSPTAPPSFTTSATAAPTSVGPDGSVSLSASFTSATAMTVALVVSIFAPDSALPVHQESLTNESFGAGQQRSYPLAWAVPANASPGTYRVGLGVYSTDWAMEYKWTDSVTTFAVTAPPATPAPTASAVSTSTQPPTAAPVATTTPLPSFTLDASVSPSGVIAGGVVTITASALSATAVSGAIADIYVYAPDGATLLGEQAFRDQAFTAGQQRSYSMSWTTAPGASSGTYIVKVGVASAGWLQTLGWNGRAATFAVTAAAASPTPTTAPTTAPTTGPTTAPTTAPTTGPTTAPTTAPTTPPTTPPTAVPTATPAASYTLSGSVSPSSIVSGAAVTVNASVTSATARSGDIVVLYVYAPDGLTLLSELSFKDQTFTAGQQRSYPMIWTSPVGASTGTYTVKLGVASAGWAQNLAWNAGAATFAVTSSVAPTPVPTPTAAPPPTAPPSSGTASPIHVQGNRLVNAVGQQVVLRGVNRSGAEYACVQGWGISEGAWDQASVNAIKSWHANAVRLPLNEQCWLGINGISSAYAGANYRNAIVNYVNLLNQSGLYVLLDLHWSAPGTTLATRQVAMPDLDHSPAFWSSVASTFKGNDAVIFELFNEPWPDNQADSVAAWTCWRDGGTCPGVGFQVAGMQTMLNSVRATGATNVVALGGVGYANYLSRWLQYKPSDPLNNLMAAWHVYTFNACNNVTCWNGAPASVIAQVPVSVTETGENRCDATWWNTLLDWLDARQTGYQAWAWNTWGGADCTYTTGNVSLGALITNLGGTPTPYGDIYRAHLGRF